MAQFRIVNRVRRIAWRMAAALLLAIGGLAGSCYGTMVDFEDLLLPPNSYWNGSDGSGGFTSRGAFFHNSYSSDYGSWGGFAYSSVNYTTTSFEPDPISNPSCQFAAVTGTGVGGSGTYAVGYGASSLVGSVLPEITIPAGMEVHSAMLTNTTYAVASMLNGDSFAKQFGPSDWLKLTITGACAPGHSLGSVQFYLAKNGSIVNTWQSVDLSSLAPARTLTFDLTSSDSDLVNGMNTPAFFAMDDLLLSPLLPGDFNLDGRVDGLDRDILMANLGRTGPSVTWSSGDANCDGHVDNLDRQIWFANAGRILAANAMPGSAGVPEPSSMALLAVVALAAAAVYRRK